MQDKSVLVTGAAGGVGKAIARRFAEQGASVLVTDIDARAAGQVAEAIGGQGRARAATLDVGDAASIEFAVASIVGWTGRRSEEHTSELQSLMRISYAVFCLQKKKQTHRNPH